MTKTILITGASSGIGRATAETFLEAGWTVGLMARRVELLEEIAEGRDNAVVLPGDVTDPATVDTEGGHSQMPYDELCEWCVGEMEAVFSDRDVVYVQTVHYVHTLCVQNSRWSAAAMYGEIILPAFRYISK